VLLGALLGLLGVFFLVEIPISLFLIVLGLVFFLIEILILDLALSIHLVFREMIASPLGRKFCKTFKAGFLQSLSD
jgi:hypothetical protein